MDRLKRKNMFIKEEIKEAIYSQLFKNCYTKEEIDEYIETRNLKIILLAKKRTICTFYLIKTNVKAFPNQ